MGFYSTQLPGSSGQAGIIQKRIQNQNEASRCARIFSNQIKQNMNVVHNLSTQILIHQIAMPLPWSVTCRGTTFPWIFHDFRRFPPDLSDPKPKEAPCVSGGIATGCAGSSCSACGVCNTSTLGGGGKGGSWGSWSWFQGKKWHYNPTQVMIIDLGPSCFSPHCT